MQSRVLFGLALALSIAIAGCTKPTEAIIPTDVGKWDTDLAPHVQKLPEEDKKLISAYLVRVKLGEAFGKEGMPLGTTIADGIAAQKKWVADQEKKEAEERALKEKMEKEAAEARAVLDNTLTVALIKLGSRPKNYDVGRFSEQQEFSIAIQNKAQKEIRGVSGRIVFVDIFDKTLGSVVFDVTEKIAPGGTVRWDGVRDYNQFIPEHKAIWNLREGDYKTRFEPRAIVFSDGTVLSAEK